jgi:hypothetical protein
VFNNFSAEYGFNRRNHILHVSGSNETGEVFFITRPGPSDGKSSFAERLIRKQVKVVLLIYQVGAGIGGALVKNKTFIISTLNILLILKNN